MTKTETPTPERDAMKYETRTTSVTVYPAGESMYSELATKIESLKKSIKKLETLQFIAPTAPINCDD